VNPLSPHEKELILLRKQVADLEFRLQEILEREADITAALIEEYGLSPTQGELLAIIYGANGHFVSKERIIVRLYGYEASIGEKIVDIFLCKIRKRLAPHGIEIESKYARGLRMPPASLARVRAAIEGQAEPLLIAESVHG
jgi:DNA-binding response OmpR family regulator